MCLYAVRVTETDEERKANELRKVIKIAEKDIKVYKRFTIAREWGYNKRGEYRLLNKGLQTPFQDTPLPKSGILSTKKFTVGHVNIGSDYSITINQGIHAYTTKNRANANLSTDEVIKIMIIPKGTKYIIGTNNEIVALKMKLK